MEGEIKLGSLFSGSGGFELAGSLSGITPVWNSEIEPFPILVTTKRFPKVKHLGDVSSISGAEIEPVDVISFGSPCQDLSIAGKRKGLNHQELGDEETTRSGLFMEAVRIIKEMKEATNGRYPRFAVWENVPGAYSSNKGEDFRIVLEELEKAASGNSVYVSKPPKGKWLNAGEIVGDNYSIAWRTLDAQYWGVPQRRRRIYLVADFRGQCAGKILFECEGLRGDTAQSGTQGQGTARNAENCSGADDRAGKILTVEPGAASRLGGYCWENVAGTLRAEPGDNRMVVVYDGANVTSPINKQNPQPDDPCHTLSTDCRNYLCYDVRFSSEGTKNWRGHCHKTDVSRALDTGGGHPDSNHDGIAVIEPKCYAIENHPADSRVNIDESGKIQTLTSRMGTGGGNVPMVMEQPPVICLQGNGIDRADTAGCNGRGWNDKTCYRLNTIDRPAVCYAMQAIGEYKQSDKASSLKMHDYKDATDSVVENEEPQYIVRRLTPLECCRLQGFPDCWTAGLEIENPTEEDLIFWREVFETHRKIVTGASKPKTDKQIIKWLQNPYSDSAEYKMWGNGIALPNALFVMQGIAEELKEQEK